MPRRHKQKNFSRLDEGPEESAEVRFSRLHDELTSNIYQEVSNMSPWEMYQIALEVARRTGDRSLANEMERKIRLNMEAKVESELLVSNSLLMRLMLGRSTIIEAGDGDQSPLFGEEAERRTQVWSTGMDWNPESPFASDWMKILAAGDAERLESFLANVEPTSYKRLVDRRETLLRFSGLLHIVKGATVLENGRFERHLPFVDHTKKPQHLKCLLKLIELGADVNAKDCMGNTPLFFCVMPGNESTFALAKALLKHGADVNAKDRVGRPPIFEAVVARKLEFVKLFLDHGANPGVTDHKGLRVEALKLHDADLAALVTEARKREGKRMREVERRKRGGNLKSCGACGQANSSRCTGCYISYYCGSECQKADWPNHKANCRQVKSEFMVVRLDEYRGVNRSYQTGERRYMANATKPSKGAFIVKVQVVYKLNNPPKGSKEKPSLTVYDKGKDLYGTLCSTEAAYAPLVENIEAHGVFGDKGYFYALYERNVLKINPCRILPPEAW